MEEPLFQGAESRIYLVNHLGKQMLMKERFRKGYRIPELDEHLTKERMKAECRNNIRCKQAGIKTPAIYFVDFDKKLIFMEYFEKSIAVNAYIQKVVNNSKNEKNDGEQKLLEISSQIGEMIAKMHKQSIVHGDLTTSNFLVIEKSDKIANLVLIDFGLSQSEGSNEDKAVDLYVLERALNMTTHSCADHLFKNIVKSYSKIYGAKSKDIFKKLEEVRSRGRKRTMIG